MGRLPAALVAISVLVGAAPPTAAEEAHPMSQNAEACQSAEVYSTLLKMAQTGEDIGKINGYIDAMRSSGQCVNLKRGDWILLLGVIPIRGVIVAKIRRSLPGPIYYTSAQSIEN